MNLKDAIERVGEWLRAHPEARREFLDESIENDTTAADLLGETR